MDSKIDIEHCAIPYHEQQEWLMLDWVALEERFQLVDKLSTSTHTTVYRGSFQGRQAVIKASPQSPEALLAFRREAALLALLRHPLAPACFEVGEAAQQVYLAMEYIEGRTLRAHLVEEGAWSVPQVIRLMRDLLQQLIALHRNHYVHRDIKPDNIIIDPAGGAHLIDYHSAVLTQSLAEETGADVGTIAYSAPEQTRMLARPLDTRADIYALGVVIYECLTGELPLQAQSAEELALLHASRPAPLLDTQLADAPHWLTALLARCLAKDPNDRFSHARHILTLLDEVESRQVAPSVAAWQQEFQLFESAGAQASFGGLPFVGRREEIELFRELRQRDQKQEKGGLLLIEALPGVGKSRLSRELLQLANPEFGEVIKCVRGNNVPLAPWRTLLLHFWHRLQSLPQPRRVAIEAQLRKSLESYAPLLWELSPVWRDLWSAQGSEPIHSTTTRELYYTMLSDLLEQIAIATRSMVLVLDDVQWMDLGSLEIIKRLGHQWKRVPLWIIATARNDPESREGLEAFRGVCQGQLEFVLEPLCKADVLALTEEYLGVAPGEILLHYLWEQCKGSPFALQQYLKVLIDEGLLWPGSGQWHFDEAATTSLALPRDVVALLLRRIQQLSPAVLEVLNVAAVLGYRSDFSLLESLALFGNEALAAALSEAMSQQLMQREGERYRFSHDRIHEAFLAGLSPAKKRALHRSVAKKLEDTGVIEGPRLFLCAHHWMASLAPDAAAIEAQKRYTADAIESQKRYTADAIESQECHTADAIESQEHHATDADAIAALCLRAGAAALAAYAEQEAHAFLEGARKAYEIAGTRPDPMLYFHFAIACFRLGKIEQAHTHLHQLLDVSSDPLLRARAHHTLADLLIMDYKPNQARQALECAFQELGVSPPDTRIWGLFRALYAWLAGILILVTGWGLGAASGIEADRKRLLIDLYETYSRTSFFLMRDFEFLQSIFLMFYMAHQLGKPADLVRAYNAYGLFVGNMSLPKKVMKYRDLALVQAKDDPPLVARTMIYAYWGLNFTGADPGLTQKFNHALSTYGHLMDPFEWANCNAVLEMALGIHGYMAEAEKVALQSIHQLKINNEQIVEHRALHGPMHTLAIARSALGRLAEAQENYREAQALLRLESDSPYTQCWALGASAQMYLELHDFGEPFEQICEAHKAYPVRPAQAPIYLRFFFVYQAMGRTLQYLAASAAQRPALWPKWQAAYKALQRTNNRPFFEAFCVYVKGAMAFAADDLDKAAQALTRANELALLWDNPMLQCESLFLIAQVFQAQGLVRQSALASEQAYGLAKRHQWQIRIRRISHAFPHCASAAQLQSSRSTTTTQTTDFSSIRIKRHMHALLQINLATSVTREPAQRARAILEQLLGLLGAERACLFVVPQAQADTSPALQLVASVHATAAIEPSHPPKELSYDQGAIAHVRETRELFVYPAAGFDKGDEQQRIRSIIAAPLLMHDELRGIVYLDSHIVSGLFHQEDAEILQALANHIAIAMDAAETADTLAKAHDKALAANKAKSMFLATMSHELRTPLNAILGYAGLILEDFSDELPQEALGDLQSIEIAGHRLLRIIEDVLALTDLDTSRFVITPSVFSPTPFVQEIVDKITPLVEAGRNQLVLHLPASSEMICSDRHKCRQILFHLLHNAARFTRGGTIQLSLERKEEGWNVVISDTGVGIEQALLARIFDPFFQADMSHSREHDGAGMGLAIAQRFCLALGGTIEVESIPHKGSTFRVTLPQLKCDQVEGALLQGS